MAKIKLLSLFLISEHTFFFFRYNHSIFYLKIFNREFDTSFSIVKTRHIEITPLAVNFFVKFYDFVSACRCSL